MIFSFNPDLLNKKGTKCGPFTEKNRPTQEVQHLISSFWAGPRRIWDQKLIFYGPLYSGTFFGGQIRGRAMTPPPPPPPPVTMPLLYYLHRTLAVHRLTTGQSEVIIAKLIYYVMLCNANVI